MPFLFVQFLLWILVGGFVGWLTGKNMRRFGYGPLIDVAMGATGAAAAGFMIGSPASPGLLGMITTVLGSALGAVMLTALVAFASGERRHA